MPSSIGPALDAKRERLTTQINERLAQIGIKALDRLFKLLEEGEDFHSLRAVAAKSLPEDRLVTIIEMWPEMEDRIARIVLKDDAKRAVPAFLAAAKIVGRDGSKNGDGRKGDVLNLNILTTPEGKKQLLELTNVLDHEPGDPTKVT